MNRPGQDITEHSEKGINMVSVYRAMLDIVAYLDKQLYTAVSSSERQDAVREHNDLSHPASEKGTSQG